MSTAALPLPSREGAVDDAVVVFDAADRVLCHNAAFTAIWRLPEASYVGVAFWELVEAVLPCCAAPDDLIASAALHQSATTFRGEIPLRDGRLLERSSSFVTDASGATLRVAVYRDLTATRRGDEELQARLREERAMARVSRLALEATDERTLLADAALAVADALGCGGGAFVRDPDGLRFVPSGRSVATHAEALDTIANVLEAATERVRTRAQLALADRLITVGTLAAGIAHEINNPLASVASNAAFVLRELEELATATGAGAPCSAAFASFRDAARDALEDVSAGLARIARAVSDMQALAHGTEHRPVNLRDVIETALTLAKHRLPANATVLSEVEDLPVVVGAEGLLVQALVNLLANASDAFPDGASPEACRVTVRALPAGTDRVELTVSDTGSGMAPEVSARVFEPFFTTKRAGTGSGLGLPIVQAIVARHGGDVRLETAPGRGTTVTVVLPIAAGEPRRARAPRSV
jgi:signal transduction histidine kinase